MVVEGVGLSAVVKNPLPPASKTRPAVLPTSKGTNSKRPSVREDSDISPTAVVEKMRSAGTFEPGEGTDGV